MVNATTYNIELRTKAGALKQYLTPYASDISWEWLAVGGCGCCSMTINKEYLSIEFDAADDIQIRVENANGVGSRLVYRGWIAGVTPKLDTTQSIVLDIRGYFELLNKIIIQDAGDIKTFTAERVSDIVDSIYTSFIDPNTTITKGTIDTAQFEVDTLEFKSSVAEALKTLADLEGDVEYGVDEDLVFFWRAKSRTVNYKFFVGNNVERLERRTDWSRLCNKIYFEGGTVNDAVLITSGGATDSQTKYFLAEKIITNSAIVTTSTADRYIGATLKTEAKPALILKVKVANISSRLEDNIPLGRIGVSDIDFDQPRYLWGTTANGGDNILWGRTADGGSGAIWGGSFRGWVDRIKYKLSENSGRFHIEVEFGVATYETSKIIKRIEHQLNSLRQR